MQSISMDELYKFAEKLGSKDLVLDVRTPEEFAEGHVPGAKNIPYDEIESRVEELKGVENIYIYCRSGRRVSVSMAILDHLGLDTVGIKNIFGVDDGGFPEWEDANYPVEK